MADYETKQIEIGDIRLDNDNSRHDQTKDEDQALAELLLDDNEHKVIELAEDIVQLGRTDPSSKLRDLSPCMTHISD